MQGFFNTTFTHRRDSDIFLPYGRVELLQQYASTEHRGRWLEKTSTMLNRSDLLRRRKEVTNNV